MPAMQRGCLFLPKNKTMLDLTTWGIIGLIVVLAVGLFILRGKNPRRK